MKLSALDCAVDAAPEASYTPDPIAVCTCEEVQPPEAVVEVLQTTPVVEENGALALVPGI